MAESALPGAAVLNGEDLRAALLEAASSRRGERGLARAAQLLREHILVRLEPGLLAPQAPRDADSQGACIHLSLQDPSDKPLDTGAACVVVNASGRTRTSLGCVHCRRPVDLDVQLQPLGKHDETTSTASPKLSQKDRHACCVVLTDSSEKRFLEALVLGRSLIDVGSTKDRILLYGHDVPTHYLQDLAVVWQTKGCSSGAAPVASKSDSRAKNRRALAGGQPRPHHLARLLALELTDYTKVLVCDLGFVFQQCPDPLFGLDCPAGFLKGPPGSAVGGRDLEATLLLLQPDAKAFNRICDDLAPDSVSWWPRTTTEGGLRHSGHGRNALGALFEEYLSRFYSTFYSGRWARMPSSSAPKWISEGDPLPPYGVNFVMGQRRSDASLGNFPQGASFWEEQAARALSSQAGKLKSAVQPKENAPPQVTVSKPVGSLEGPAQASTGLFAMLGSFVRRALLGTTDPPPQQKQLSGKDKMAYLWSPSQPTADHQQPAKKVVCAQSPGQPAANHQEAVKERVACALLGQPTNRQLPAALSPSPPTADHHQPVKEKMASVRPPSQPEATQQEHAGEKVASVRPPRRPTADDQHSAKEKMAYLLSRGQPASRGPDKSVTIETSDEPAPCSGPLLPLAKSAGPNPAHSHQEVSARTPPPPGNCATNGLVCSPVSVKQSTPPNGGITTVEGMGVTSGQPSPAVAVACVSCTGPLEDSATPRQECASAREGVRNESRQPLPAAAGACFPCAEEPSKATAPQQDGAITGEGVGNVPGQPSLAASVACLPRHGEPKKLPSPQKEDTIAWAGQPSPAVAGARLPCPGGPKKPTAPQEDGAISGEGVRSTPGQPQVAASEACLPCPGKPKTPAQSARDKLAYLLSPGHTPSRSKNPSEGVRARVAVDHGIVADAAGGAVNREDVGHACEGGDDTCRAISTRRGIDGKSDDGRDVHPREGIPPAG